MTDLPLALTMTERTAILALNQTELQLVPQLEALNRDKAAVAAEIEQRLRLEPGALGTTHQISADIATVDPVPANGQPVPA